MSISPPPTVAGATALILARALYSLKETKNPQCLTRELLPVDLRGQARRAQTPRQNRDNRRINHPAYRRAAEGWAADMTGPINGSSRRLICGQHGGKHGSPCSNRAPTICCPTT